MTEKQLKFEIAFYSPCDKKAEDGNVHIAVIVKDILGISVSSVISL